MRLSRGKSIDSLPRGVITSVSNFMGSSTRDVDPSIGYFGVSLETVMKRPSESLNKIPSIIENIFNYLEEQEAHKVEGIFRVCGAQSSMDELMDLYDEGKTVDLRQYNIHVIANCLKFYFQILPQPVLTTELSERFVSALSIQDKQLRIDYFNCLISSLPINHFEICKRLVMYFKKVASFGNVNKMDINNVGIIVGPLIWRTREDNEEFYQNFLEYSKFTVRIGELIVKDADYLFIQTTPLHCFRARKQYKSGSD